MNWLATPKYDKLVILRRNIIGMINIKKITLQLMILQKDFQDIQILLILLMDGICNICMDVKGISSQQLVERLGIEKKLLQKMVVERLFRLLQLYFVE